jgi:hypothetical protein
MTKYTPWFPGFIKPVRKGVYQRKVNNVVKCYSYWDGELWFLGERTVDKAHREPMLSFNQNGFEWRGLRG